MTKVVGSASSPVTVWSGTLGRGSLAGAGSIRSGAPLAPGASAIGTVTMSKTFTLVAGRTNVF